ncbi:MAG: glutathione S-transferase C-terminal domain-containing protein [Baekduia sp.]
MSAEAQYGKESGGDGSFNRQQSAFREHVTERPEPGRYHLYVSLACPWASRILIARKLKQLEELLTVTVVDPIRDERGWRFTDEPDPVNGFEFLAEAYEQTQPGFSDRVTVPVLWDIAEGRIVNNESAELLRMLNGWSSDGPDLYPETHRAEIDELNERIYNTLNNGVYRAGFATRQAAYEEGVRGVFETLAWLSERLAGQRWLVAGNDQPTEADWRLFVTLVRFDAAYVGHFKCNIHRIADDPVLEGYLRDLYQQPGIAETVSIDHIKRHYYGTHEKINPTRIVPVGPTLHLDGPHERDRLG